MPPRHAYWTIIIDNLPTAFRAARVDELLPTFERLRRKHPTAVMRWFARGRLWESPEAARRAQPAPARAKDWRPGGAHRDPRDRGPRRPSRWRAIRERRKAGGGVAPGPHGAPKAGAPPGRGNPDRTRREPSSSQRRGPSSQGRGPSSQGRGPSSQGRGPSSQGRGPSSQGRGPSSSQGRGPSSQGRGPSSSQRRGSSRPDRRHPRPDQERPGFPHPPPPKPPPGPARPPRPGAEPDPVPSRPEEIVIPREPPERGRHGGVRRPPAERKRSRR